MTFLAKVFILYVTLESILQFSQIINVHLKLIFLVTEQCFFLFPYWTVKQIALLSLMMIMMMTSLWALPDKTHPRELLHVQLRVAGDHAFMMTAQMMKNHNRKGKDDTLIWEILTLLFFSIFIESFDNLTSSFYTYILRFIISNAILDF